MRGVVSKALSPGAVRNALNGTWLGHPAHPMLTDVVIGSWTSAFFLDLLGGKPARPAADRLVGLGVLAALPTAAAGLADWADSSSVDRRVGLVHALINVKATALYSLSYLARRRGRRSAGVALGLLGAAAATVSGHLGGHLSYRRGVNVNRNAWHDGPSEWEPAGVDPGLAEGEPVLGQAGDAEVLIVRQGPRICALGDVCSHAGGPLHEGKVGGGRVTCPWHGSTFELTDGAVVTGPATAPQPAYDVRVEGGTVSVRQKN
ncbi:MAG: Rieske (2Fe-2S) protein [Actinomycetota bacterium]|nr:Rieske (2Fe-2S) protein [Actinomycetota bacterium]